jgi:hypothetical protein
MERIDITLRGGVALFCCGRCGDELVINQELPFMPQLRHVVSHVCDDRKAAPRVLRLVDEADIEDAARGWSRP